MTWKQSINTGSTGTTAKFGAFDINKYSKLLSGEADIDTVTINSPFEIQNDKLKLGNFAANASGTVLNPVFTSNSNLDLFKNAYKLYIYQDPRDGFFKAVNGMNGKIELNSGSSTDCGQLVQDAVDFNSNQPGIIEFADNTTFPLKSENGNVYDLEATGGYAAGAGSVRYSIRLRSGIWIKGAGWRTIIYAADPPTTSTAPGIFFGDGGAGIGAASATEGDIFISDIQLLGRCLDGNTNYGSMGNVKLFGFDRVVLHRIKSMFASQSSLQTQYCNNTSITDCYVESSRLQGGAGIGAIMNAFNSDHTIICNNFIKNAGGEAIGIYYHPTNFVISGNTSVITTGSGLAEEYGRGQIHVESSTANTPTAKFGTIADNTIWNNYYGVVLLQCSFINIHDNIIRHTGFTSTGDAKNNIKEGIRLIGESIGCDIHDNLLYDIAGDGIYLESTGNINFFASGNFNGTHIHDNKIVNIGRATSNTYDGIHVVQATRNADGLNIHDNLIYDTGGTALMRDGIRIDIDSGKSIINLNIHNNNIKDQ